MTTPNPVDLDALDAIVANHTHDSLCYDECEAEKEVVDAYPALSAELRRLRGLVREYAEARQAWEDWKGDDGDEALDDVYGELDRAEEALYAAGKEIAK